MDPRVRHVIDMMETHLHMPLTASAMALRAGLSVGHLTRLFRAGTGRAPCAYLRELRLARARVLIERTSLPLDAVMAHVGISDRSHFARDFRRAHGLSPRFLRIRRRAAGGPEPPGERMTRG